MILLHYSENNVGEPLYVNKDKIDVVCRNLVTRDGSCVFVSGSDKPIKVQETVSDIISEINFE